MTRIHVALVVLAFTATAFANDAAQELNTAASVIRDMTASHQIPSSVLSETECITVLPAVAKAAVIVGGKHGFGVASCRTRSGWSAPAFVSITSASVGFQAGLEHQDIVLLMNKQGEQELSKGEWNFGAETAAAGPNTPATGGPQSTGWKTPVLVYTTSSGAFAGASLEGSKISMNESNMRAFYGANVTSQTVLSGGVQAPESAQAFLSTLREVAGK